jgi:hypothetical protein
VGAVRSRARGAAPVLAVGAAAVALWLAGDVAPLEIAVFAGYQLLFVLGPGWLLYRVLASGEPLGRTLAFGWALGYVLEIAAFIAASAIGARSLFVLYPLLALPLVPSALRARTATARPEPGPRPAWAAAGIAVVSLAYLALMYFTKTPLPEDVSKATYNTDIPFHLTLAAEAKHHWPLTDPNVAGTDLFYHVWAHLDLAAASTVTELPLPLLLFRLAVLPLTALFVAGLVVAGRALTGRAWSGVLAAGMVLLVGEVDVETIYSFPFMGLFFTDLWVSPTFLLGLVVFVPALTLIAETITSEARWRERRGRWLLLTLFLVGCGGAKATILPVLLGGLALTIAIRRWRTRRFERNAVAALALVALVFAAYQAAIYGRAAVGLGLDPFGGFGDMAWVTELRSWVGDGVGWPLGVLIATVVLFAVPIAGLVAFAALRRAPLDDGRTLLLATFAVGLGPFFLLHQEGNSQIFFSHYGLVAASFVAAEGLLLLASTWAPRAVARAAAATAAAVAISIVLVAYAIGRLPAWSVVKLGRSYAYEITLATLVVVFALVWLWSAPTGRRSPLLAAALTGTTGAFVGIWRVWRVDVEHVALGLVLALVVVLAAATLVAPAPRRRELALLLVVAIAVPGALDVPLDQGPDAIDRLQDGSPFFNAGETGLNAGLYDGLAWIRDNTGEDTVIAVNNHEERNGGVVLPTFVYYGAFAERRVFLQGWLFTATAWRLGGEDVREGRKVPFPERLRLNRAVFERGDADALRVLVEEHGVGFLVDDRLQGRSSPALAGLGRVVFRNPSVVVYDVGGSGPAT